MFMVWIVTCIAMVAWGLEPKSIMAEWVSGAAALIGLVMLAYQYRCRVGSRGLR